MRGVLVALALSCLSPAVAPVADAQSDQQRALDAVSAGLAKPLKQVLSALRHDYPGEVLDAQLVERDGGWYYRIKLLGADGKVQELTVDARSGIVIDRR
jgi:uncharacterized membrane protein YkoI